MLVDSFAKLSIFLFLDYCNLFNQFFTKFTRGTFYLKIKFPWKIIKRLNLKKFPYHGQLPDATSI